MRLLASLLLLSALPAAETVRRELPASTLAVEHRGVWRTWWRAERAPRRWGGALPGVQRAAGWRPVAAGVEVGELRLGGSGEAWRTRVILLRFDPRRVRVGLRHAVTDDGLGGDWSVDDAPEGSLAAFNAGQFSMGRPWGWVVAGGRELQPPGSGPLAAAIAVDAEGRFVWLDAGAVQGYRAAARPVLAFQSYPVLLQGDGEVPLPLREAGRGIDVGHRDSRLAIGEARDGRIIVALTRFDALGGVLSTAPFGPTVPEMAAVMGALGCRRAVALDGGISGQLMVRGPAGARRYPAWRRVPLGVVLTPRAE